MGVFNFLPVTAYFEPNPAGESHVMIQGVGSNTWFTDKGKSVKLAKVPKGNLVRLWLEQEPPDQHLLAGEECATLADLNYDKDGIVEAESDGNVATTFRRFFRETGRNYLLTKKCMTLAMFNMNDWRKGTFFS